MNMEKIYREEDMFPLQIASYNERDYGFLFYNKNNKASYDSNHALIFRDRTSNISRVLEDIKSFYTGKGIRPVIYQSISDEGYFEEIKDILAKAGFDSWAEPQRYMLLTEESSIHPNSEITVRKISRWQKEFAAEIFEKSGEPWETAAAKRSLENGSTIFFAAYCGGKPVGMTYAHRSDGVCRVDYLLTEPGHRGMGVGSALIDSFTCHCRENKIENCFLWPGSETAERIYHGAGFRYIETKQAGRAAYGG